MNCRYFSPAEWVPGTHGTWTWMVRPYNCFGNFWRTKKSLVPAGNHWWFLIFKPIAWATTTSLHILTTVLMIHFTINWPRKHFFFQFWFGADGCQHFPVNGDWIEIFKRYSTHIGWDWISINIILFPVFSFCWVKSEVLVTHSHIILSYLIKRISNNTLSLQKWYKVISHNSEQYEYNDDCEYVTLMCKYFKVLTNSTNQRPSWETNSLSASKEIPCTLWNQEIHYHIHNSLALVNTLNYMTTVHTLPSMSNPSKWSLSLRFTNQISVSISLLLHMLHMPCSTHPSWLDDQRILDKEFKLWSSLLYSKSHVLYYKLILKEWTK